MEKTSLEKDDHEQLERSTSLVLYCTLLLKDKNLQIIIITAVFPQSCFFLKNTLNSSTFKLLQFGKSKTRVDVRLISCVTAEI